ncbi:bifunctional 4-hydroxy-2-oxoglutarate aldolase/2-dehydro-3-deoxy-phosphogluconate aldolase [Reinekea blandensis]|uniref:2-dehydro-3-deoxy-phosphogluconate aldolase n=1 Tax=Reinekea blandensis MED297 TaxID=314283 RepID=A4BHQ8_9GAMM|nr:bifunctional 4-hydroxy-2-oxoglutarate aldolase/2-dehydro-3-deoxy-phosphogluconate aldolase [Reinekea blandensis]EAR08313.1 putative 2-keto-3-deoxy-6-phosphogluconatealdolase [Reinekea sp. MED297] [Reinekea blandensis MED297]
MNTILDLLKPFRIIPVVDLNDVADGEWLADQLIDAGLPVAEITLRSPNALAVLSAMKQRQPDLCIGAGTVLTADQARQVKSLGADFAVSPGLNPAVVSTAQQINLPMIPGVCTPSEIERALSMDITAVKFFPAEASGGVAFLKAVLAPYGMMSVMPTGGINPDNLSSYLSIPQVMACGGSWFVKPELIRARKAKDIINLIKTALIIAADVDQTTH